MLIIRDEKIVARKLTPWELSEKWKIVIKLRLKGMSNKEASEIVEIAQQATSTYFAQFKKEGKSVFDVKNAGRPKRSGEKLSDAQEGKIIRMLIDTTHWQLKFKFALWTREAAWTPIKHELDIDMPLLTVGSYLKRWEFTSKKPIKRAYERKDVIA